MGKEEIDNLRKDGLSDEMIEAMLELCLSDKRVVGEERQKYKEMLYYLRHEGK